VGAVRFERLREAIDNLDFQLGAELLRETLPLDGKAGLSRAKRGRRTADDIHMARIAVLQV